MTHAELLAAIKVYCDSGYVFSPEGLADHLWGNWQQVELLKQHRAQSNGVLTPRRWQVLALVAEGLQDHEIAARLGTSINTVHHQEASIRRKLGGLRNRAAMTRWYVEHAGANTAKEYRAAMTRWYVEHVMWRDKNGRS